MRIARSSNAGSWLAFGTCVLPTALDLVTALSVPQSDENASWSGGGYLFNAIFVLALLSFAAVGLLIAIKGRGGVISRLLLAIGLSWGVADLTAYPDAGIHARPGNLPADITAVLASCAWLPAIGLTGTFLILLFPDGRLPGRRWRWVGWTSAVSIAVGTLTIVLTPGKLDQTGYPDTMNPLRVDALAGVLDPLRLIILVVPMMMVASAVSLMVRYRRSAGLERQQLKWLAAAAGSTAVRTTRRRPWPVSAAGYASRSIWTRSPPTSSTRRRRPSARARSACGCGARYERLDLPRSIMPVMTS